MKLDFLKRKRNIIVIILIILFAVYLMLPLLSTGSYVTCQKPPPSGCQLSYGYGATGISTETIDSEVRNFCGDDLFSRYTSICSVKANEPFILLTSNEGGYAMGGCFLSSIIYDNRSLQEIEPLNQYGPFSLFSGHSVYHRFVAKGPGESVVYTLGSCDYFRRYKIIAG